MLWTGLEHQSCDMAGKIEEGFLLLLLLEGAHTFSVWKCGGGHLKRGLLLPKSSHKITLEVS